jgi:hypothetical protein
MSKAYLESVRVGSQAGPDPGMGKETWSRHRQVAGDKRLSAIDPSLLPDTFSALYELSKMSDAVLVRVLGLGLLGPHTTSRFLKTIRVTGRVRLETVLYVPIEKVETARDGIVELRNALG